MDVEFDPTKRAATLLERGLDFTDASKVFNGQTFTRLDDRFDYGEDRWITGGTLEGRFVVIVWTWRGDTRRILPMRHAHADEAQYRRAAAPD